MTIQRFISGWTDKSYTQESVNKAIYSLVVAEEIGVRARIPVPSREMWRNGWWGCFSRRLLEESVCIGDGPGSTSRVEMQGREQFSR